jgi:hypothetical protein
MTIERHSTVVGVFQDRSAAQKAVAELRRRGFREDQLGVVARDERGDVVTETAAETGSKAGEGAATGVIAGAGVGALWALGIVTLGLPAVGPAIAGGIFASLLASAAGTAVVGGLIGALIGLGIPEEEARYYESEVHGGRTLVTVQAPGRYEEAEDVLRNFGADDLRNRPATTGSAAASAVEVSVSRADVGARTAAVDTAPAVEVPVHEGQLAGHHPAPEVRPGGEGCVMPPSGAPRGRDITGGA